MSCQRAICFSLNMWRASGMPRILSARRLCQYRARCQRCRRGEQRRKTLPHARCWDADTFPTILDARGGISAGQPGPNGQRCRLKRDERSVRRGSGRWCDGVNLATCIHLQHGEGYGAMNVMGSDAWLYCDASSERSLSSGNQRGCSYS